MVEPKNYSLDSTHTSNKESAEEICKAVKDDYFSLFQQLETRLDILKTGTD
ncbi:hypothetical protein [Desulfosarcina alkanivorans]|uniref:hypothetical protein n=1 Tax=Desulfosarcina alkanivorans TaxID=571177 RepID=UPI0012D3166F|nr:hypothetical protein [Desulfosarcina alkanivorans]